MKYLLAILFVGNIVFGDGDFRLSKMGFGGDGKSICDPSGNCAYAFSSGFQNQICGVTNMFGGWWKQNKWCAQGISEYGDYVTRIFYEGGEADYTDYVAVSVIEKGNAVRYSNILVAQPENGQKPCHAGGMVLTEVNGVYWFVIACSSWMMVFPETAIVKLSSKGYEVNNKKFYYRVNADDVKCIYQESGIGIKLSWISRNQGTNNQFWTGKCDANVCGAASFWKTDCKKYTDMSLKLITLDVENTWEITDVESYSFPTAPTWVQGATRSGDYMYLVISDEYMIYKCGPISGTTVGGCKKICKFPFTDGYIQGAEVDQKGNLWVATEFGVPRARWFKLQNLDSRNWYDLEAIFDGVPWCLSLFNSAAAPKINNIEFEEKPTPTEKYISEWTYQQIGMVLLFGVVMLMCGMSTMMHCNNRKIQYYSSVKTVSDSEV